MSNFLSHPGRKGDKADLIARHLAAPAGAMSCSMDFKCFRLITLSVGFVLSCTGWKTSRPDWASCIQLHWCQESRSISVVSLQNIAAFVFISLLVLLCWGWALCRFVCPANVAGCSPSRPCRWPEDFGYSHSSMRILLRCQVPWADEAAEPPFVAVLGVLHCFHPD